MKTTLIALTMAALAAPAVRAADTWSIDTAHSEAGFQVRHLVSSVRGSFGKFEGAIVTDAARPGSSSVEFALEVASIDTGVADRDKHLRSADFFDAVQFPRIVFKSTSIKPTGKDTFDVTGNLTMRGVTRQITLPVTFLGSAKDPWGNDKAGFETAITLNRKDYGINWNKALDQGGFLLSDDVKVSISIAAVKQKPTPTAANR
jgi:polyisoprenoid-binding protein YceI